MMAAVTKGHRSSLGRVAIALALLAVTVGLAACGGGSKAKSTSSTTTTAKKTTSTSATPKPKPKPKLTISVSNPAVKKGYTSTTTAKPGQIVAIHVLVPIKSGSEKVAVTVAKGPSKTLTLTAKAKRDTSRATITGSSKSLTLEGLRYSCSLPPAPTFCPAHDVSVNDRSYSVSFSASRLSGVTLVGEVGPAPIKIPKTTPPGASVVPPYTVSELVIARAAKAKPPKTRVAPTSSTTAHPGDSVVLISRVASKLRGATQPLTLTIDQGPAKKITVTASVPGGTPAKATITSATGSPIAIVLPRYVCGLPPFPTFCPAKQTKVAHHRYTVVFPAAPGTAAPAISAHVQAG
jgi:hypothetical protein